MENKTSGSEIWALKIELEDDLYLVVPPGLEEAFLESQGFGKQILKDFAAHIIKKYRLNCEVFRLDSDILEVIGL